MSSPGSLIERSFALTQELTHVGSWEWQPERGVVTWSDELYRIYGLEPGSRSITAEFFLSCVVPEDRSLVQQGIARALERGGTFRWSERIARPDGSLRMLDTVGQVHGQGAGRTLFGTCRDVTEERAQSARISCERRLQAAEHEVLERVAASAPLAQSLAALVLAVEEHSPPMIASVLLLDHDGMHLRHGAAPGLPDGYQRAIDGSAIGPDAGSCGTAAFFKRAVFVSDIESDPRWARYRELALGHGLRACWSTPILSTNQRVLGTFAFYYREPREPAEVDHALARRVSRLAAIAIERRQMEDQLRDLSAHVEAALEAERTRIAREIHDDLGQSLTALKMDIAWLLRRLRDRPELVPGGIGDKLTTMSHFTDEVIQRVRSISSGLRPGVLDDLGLVPAIEWQARVFEERTGKACVVRSNRPHMALERDVATAAFRIFQEALTNVVRHAEANRVEVSVDVFEHELALEVADDGVGISREALYNPKSLGLLGARERAQRLGGQITVEARPPRGTRLKLQIPIAASGGP